MEVLAWRSQYQTGPTLNIEWFIATNWGCVQYRIRAQIISPKEVGKPQITTSVETRRFGWLKDGGMNAVRSHPFLTKMFKRGQEHGGRTTMVELASIEELEKTHKINLVVANDQKAVNAWSNVTGTPIGTSFEEIMSVAEQETRSKREAMRVEQSKIMAEIDPSYGMF